MKTNTLSCLSCIATVSNNTSFCNDIDTHYRLLAYILLRKKTSIVIPEMTSEANSSHSLLFLGRKHGNVQKIINFENS